MGEGILIFACASNHGRNKKEISFPGRMDFVFCIGASDDSGATTNFNPPHNDVIKFSVLGLGVRGHVPTPQEENLPKNQRFSTLPVSGTSFATPIAAGIAALFLDYLRPNGLCPRQLSTITDLTKIFLHISSATESEGYRYLAPWTLFEAGTKKVDHVKLIRTIIRNPPSK